MKKKKIIIILITVLISILLIILFVFKKVNYDNNNFKLAIKSLLRQELTLDEMKNSNLYKAYEQINANSNLGEINNIIKENEHYEGPFAVWDLLYGRILIGYNEYTEHNVWVKLISFETPNTIELNDNEFNSLFECKSLDEIIEILGEPIIKLEGFKESDIKYTYEWGIKAKYFEPSEYGGPLNFPLPYKRKFRVNVDVIEGNLIHKLSIKKY
jgi:uncharacterized protein YxeA